MRVLSFIFLTFLSFSLIGQTTKIKIKKEAPQYTVTLAGLETGTVSIDQIMADKQLVIQNNPLGLKIYTYEAFISFDGDQRLTAKMHEGKTKKLPKDLLDEMENQVKINPIKLHITRIQSYNNFYETINLNDIELTIVK